jgi:KTSC domain
VQHVLPFLSVERSPIPFRGHSFIFHLYRLSHLCECDAMSRVAKRPSRSAGQRCVLDSSLLAAVTYSEHATLDVAFRSGAVDRYFAVPARVVDAFLTAPSTGAYFHRQIRHRFPYQRLS